MSDVLPFQKCMERKKFYVDKRRKEKKMEKERSYSEMREIGV